MYSVLCNHFYHPFRRGFGRHTPRWHDQIRHLTVYGVALSEQRHPAFLGIACEHGATASPVGTFHGFMWVGLQIHHLAAPGHILCQAPTYGLRHRRSASQGKDAAEGIQDIAHHITLHLAKCRFPILCEIVRYAHADLAFDLHVGVEKWQTAHLRHLLAESSLSRTHHADDHGLRLPAGFARVPVVMCHALQPPNACAPATRPDSLRCCGASLRCCRLRISPAGAGPVSDAPWPPPPRRQPGLRCCQSAD